MNNEFDDKMPDPNRESIAVPFVYRLVFIIVLLYQQILGIRSTKIFIVATKTKIMGIIFISGFNV